MASQYPPFIFSDSVPASQMIEHARAVNEGMRIAELGKARQAEGMFRIAQLQQQQKSQQEKNELDRMIAQSQIAQSQLGNSLREKELTQRGAIAREGFQANIDVAKIQAGRLDPREAINAERQRYDAELEQKEEAQDQVLIREWQVLGDEAASEQAKLDVEKPGRGFLTLSRGDYNKRLEEDKRTTSRLADIKRRQQGIEAILSQRGKVPTPRRAISSALAPSAVPSFEGLPATQSIPPSAASLSQPEARLSPFAMQVQGLSPGDSITQGGQSFRATPAFEAQQNQPPPPAAAALSGDQALDELTQRYPGVNFVRDGSAIRAGGFEWDANMKRIAEDTTLTPQLKQSMITSYIRSKYPDLFRDNRDAFQRYLTPIGRGAASLIGR